MVRILGIDPGLNTTGYGVLDIEAGRLRLCEAGVVRGRNRESLTARLVEIFEGLTDVICSLQPQVMALEQLYSHYKQPRTAILMGHARGVICLAAAQAGLPVIHYSATQIKKVLTGNGRAPKWQMQQAIRQELKLAEAPEPPDVADALSVALCHYHLNVRRVLAARPKGAQIRLDTKDAAAKIPSPKIAAGRVTGTPPKGRSKKQQSDDISHSESGS